MAIPEWAQEQGQSRLVSVYSPSGEEYSVEVRPLSIREHARFIDLTRDKDYATTGLHLLLQCAYVPGTSRLAFDVRDLFVLERMPYTSWVWTACRAALAVNGAGTL